MYLLSNVHTAIFVMSKKMKQQLITIFLPLAFLFGQLNLSQAQQMWPGDINNNGIVNNVDVLYWAVANGATGAARPNATTNWEAQNLPVMLWDQSFSDSLNYAFADCDGDGDVDDDDKDIIEENFGRVHGAVRSDGFSTGEISDAIPILQLNTKDTVVAPGGTLNANISLGSAQDSITDFYGIAFTIVYSPEAVGKRGNDFLFNILENSWLSGMGNNKAIQFIQNDKEKGVAQIAIVRKDQSPVSGFGDIASISIVMEDIVFLNGSISNTDIRLINQELDDSQVAPSTIKFKVDTATVTSIRETIRKEGLKLYPNPVNGQRVNLEMEDPEERIRSIELYDTNGRLLAQQKYEGLGNKCNFKLADYSTGIYTFKVYTSRHLYVKSFYKQ